MSDDRPAAFVTPEYIAALKARDAAEKALREAWFARLELIAEGRPHDGGGPAGPCACDGKNRRV